MPSSSSHLSSPHLYDDDDIVHTHHHRHSSSSESRDASSGSSRRHHHHSHQHDSSNARLQGSWSRSASADLAVQNLYRWLVQSIIILALAALSAVLWKRNAMLAKDLENYSGTNSVLAEQNNRLEAEQKNLQMQIQNLEHDKAELERINQALGGTAPESAGGAAQ